ncbi:MAG: hypothetical protein LR015_06235 [Verrucomicrobia bacterium]|nr:hypothetical protein [Verrucomicrobiota bacterium]
MNSGDFSAISISPLASTLPFFSENLENLELEEVEVEVDEALREQLLNLRIYARDNFLVEQLARHLLGTTIFEQLITDEAAPVSEFQVAVGRISTQAAQAAVSRAVEVIGSDNSGLQRISEVVSSAFDEYSANTSDVTAHGFAAYLHSGATSSARAAAAEMDTLLELFDLIAVIGVTPTELEISRRSVISRLRIGTLRGRELFDFYDAYAAQAAMRPHAE